MNVQHPTANGPQTPNRQHPMASGLKVGIWEFVGRWALVVGISAAAGGGCCSQLQQGHDAYNEGVLLHRDRPEASHERFEAARKDLTAALRRCGLSAEETFRVLLMMARMDLYEGRVADAQRIIERLAGSPVEVALTPEERFLFLFVAAEIDLREGRALLDRLAGTGNGLEKPVEVAALAVAHFDNAARELAEADRQAEDGPARDLSLLWHAQARFEKAKAMELHDETTRKKNLSAAGAELDALAIEMTKRTPEHPDLRSEFDELKVKVEEERERVRKALK